MLIYIYRHKYDPDPWMVLEGDVAPSRMLVPTDMSEQRKTFTPSMVKPDDQGYFEFVLVRQTQDIAIYFPIDHEFERAPH